LAKDRAYTHNPEKTDYASHAEGVTSEGDIIQELLECERRLVRLFVDS